MGSFYLTVTKYYIKVGRRSDVMKSHCKERKRHCKSEILLLKLYYNMVVIPKSKIIIK